MKPRHGTKQFAMAWLCALAVGCGGAPSGSAGEANRSADPPARFPASDSARALE